jgi:protein-S-isoprenylcysteine O-methyltransferase Ste14
MTNVASLVGLGMMMAGMVSLIVRQQVVSTSPLVIVLQGVAVALMAWARVTFGRRSFHATASPTEGGIVATGPYRWLRHPIYTAICLFAWACWAGHQSWFSFGMACLVTVGGVARMLTEEALLRVRYPEYADYARKTRRMVPYLF